jgi:hypothetical protein
VIVSMMTAQTKRQKRSQWGLYGSEIPLVMNKEMLCAEHNAGSLPSRHGEEPT